MVSLINFKIVNEDLQQQQQYDNNQLQQPQQQNQPPNPQQVEQQNNITGNSQQLRDRTSSNRMFVKVMHHHNHQQQQHNLASESHQENGNKSQNLQLVSSNQLKRQPEKTPIQPVVPVSHLSPAPTVYTLPNAYPHKVAEGGDALKGLPNFVVTWRNLKFAIEPKWHQRMANANPMAAFATRQPSRQPQQQVVGNQTTAVVSKVVLDKLDGSFRSGELTAILGPSRK